jgi:cell division transport system permease protein
MSKGPKTAATAAAKSWDRVAIDPPGPLLPRQTSQDRTLGLVIALLCGLACLSAMAALASNRAASTWVRALGASATVQVRPRAGETPSEAAAKAAEALAGVKGVEEARALDRQAAEKLLEPWFGPGGVPDDLPLPRLVTVELDPKAPATVGALNKALSDAGVDASLDDHGRWIADVRRAAQIARGAAFGAVVLFALTAAGVIAFATRSTLEARRDVVEVLHLTGAEDRFLSGLVQRRFALIAAEAGAVGAVIAALIGAGMKLLGGADGFVPVLPLAWSDLLAAAPAPVLAAVIAAIAVRRTAMSILRSDQT